MINKTKNKRVQVTLPNETVELLESLSNRYNKTFSEIIKWSLNVLAAKKRHNLLIKYREQEIENNVQEESSSEEDNKILDYFEGR